MSNKLLMNYAKKTPSLTEHVNVPSETEGTGKILGDNTFEVTCSSKWSNVCLRTGVGNIVVGNKYRVTFEIININILPNAILQLAYHYPVVKNELMRGININDVAASKPGDIFSCDVTIYSEVDGSKQGRICGLQFKPQNTGSYVKFKMYIDEIKG